MTGMSGRLPLPDGCVMRILNELKNHEVYPYFWGARRTLPLETAFLDLAALQRAMDDGSAPDDETVEALLFGDSGSPRYTGWTEGLLRRIAEDTGFREAKPLGAGAGPFERRMALRPGAWDAAQRLRGQRERWGHRIWAARKGARLGATEALARARAALSPSPLKAGGELWLNLGAGAEEYRGYLKVDWGGRQDVYDNVVTLARVGDGSISKIYSNHVLEHIPPALVGAMLARWRAVLKPGGFIVARMPDARSAVKALGRRWQEADPRVAAELGFPDYLAREGRREGILDEISCVQTIYGWSASTPHAWDMSNQHKSLWTPQLTKARFEAAGFKVTFAGNLGTIQTAIVAEAAGS